MAKQILTINGGSSSIKFALFDGGDSLTRQLSGKIERIGLANATFSAAESGKPRARRPVEAPNQAAAVGALMGCLDEGVGQDALRAVGHRVVHGGPHYDMPQHVTPELLEELRRISPLRPRAHAG